jgi:hypothetical protein
MRWFLLLLIPAIGCAPVRNPGTGDDDDDDAAPTTMAERYAELDAGRCMAFWDDGAGWFQVGEGFGTTGLWNALDCNDEAAGSLTVELEYLNPEPGTALISQINARSANGSTANMGAIDDRDLHVEAGDWSTFGGWWEGEAELNSADGFTLVLTGLVFKDLRVDSVVGR